MANVIKQPINASNLSISLRNFVTIPNSFDERTETFEPPTLNYITNAEDGTGRLYVNDQRGKMYVLSSQGRLLGTFLDLKNRVGSGFEANSREKGFTYFTFHPEYETNGLFYTIHSEAPRGNATFPYNRAIPDYPFYRDRGIRPNCYNVLTEWRDNNPADNVFNGTSRRVLSIEIPYSQHNIGQIGFNPTARPGSPDYGNLYIAVGDGGQETFTETFTLNFIQTSQDLSSPLGKILRINPQGNNSRNRQYGIPQGNPTDLSNRNPNALPEIYSYGFRNPHRFSWDLNTGKMLLAEISYNSIEEVNLILPGKNYGWSQREGYYQPSFSDRFSEQPPSHWFLDPPIRQFPPNNRDGFTYPVVQYDHDYPGGAIAGGYVYQGTEIPYLRDQYIFADFSTDSRWFVSPSAQMVSGRQAPVERLRIMQNNREVSFLDILGENRSDVRFGTGENNEIYVTNKQDGIIRKVVPSAEYLNRNPHILVQNFQIEEGNTVRYPITLVGAIQRPVTVNYRATSNSALITQDFPTLQGTVTFTPSPQNQQTKYINIATRQDNLVEANENFWLNWQTTPRIPLTARTQMTIRNNDHEVIVGGALTVQEGGTFSVPLNLLGGVNEIIEIKYTLRSGTAQINDDLIVRRNTGSVVLDPRPNRTAPQPIVLRTRQDNLLERDEFFWLDLSSQQTRINQSVRLTITNDDFPRRSNLSNLSLGVTNQINSNLLTKDSEVLDFNPLTSPNETII